MRSLAPSEHRQQRNHRAPTSEAARMPDRRTQRRRSHRHVVQLASGEPPARGLARSVDDERRRARARSDRHDEHDRPGSGSLPDCSMPVESSAGSLVRDAAVVSGAGSVEGAVVAAAAVVTGAVAAGSVDSGSVGSVTGVVGGTVATGPMSAIAGAGSSSSSPGSAGIPIQRISPTSQRWTNGK